MVQPGFSLKLLIRGELRRIRFPSSNILFNELQQKITEVFPELHNTAFTLQYKDDEDCMITVKSDPELHEARRLAADSILKFTVVEKGPQTFVAPSLPTFLPQPTNDTQDHQQKESPSMTVSFQENMEDSQPSPADAALVKLEELCEQSSRASFIACHGELAKGFALAKTAICELRYGNKELISVFFEKAASEFAQALEDDKFPEAAGSLVEEYFSLMTELCGNDEWCSRRIWTAVEKITNRTEHESGDLEMDDLAEKNAVVEEPIASSPETEPDQLSELPTCGLLEVTSSSVEDPETKKKRNLEESFLRIREMGLLSDESFVAVYREQNFDPIKTFDTFFSVK